MIQPSKITTLLSFALLFACGEGTTVDQTTTPTEAAFVSGGGTAGGAIAGQLTVFIADENDTPLPGARLIVDGRRFDTDSEGRVDLEIERGPVAVHVFVDGNTPMSVTGLDARSATLIVWSGTLPTRPEARVGRVSGVVTGWDRLPPLVATSTTTDSERFAHVEPVSRGFWIEQDTREDQDLPTNMLVGGALEDYAVKIDAPTTRAIYAVGGLSSYDWETDVFETKTTHLGVLLDLDLAQGDTLEGRNIDLSHELLPMPVNVRGLPAGLSKVGGAVSVRLPRDNGDLFVGPIVQKEDGLVEAATPELSGTLAGGVYVADLYAFGGGADTSLRATGTDRTMIAEGFLSPPSAVEKTGRTVRVRSDTAVSWQSLDLTKVVETEPDPEAPSIPGGDTQHEMLWYVLDLSGDAGFEVTLPEPPTGFEDPLAEVTHARGRLIDAQIDTRDFAFDALRDNARIAGRDTTF